MTHGQGLGLRGVVAGDFRMQLRRSADNANSHLPAADSGRVHD